MRSDLRFIIEASWSGCSHVCGSCEKWRTCPAAGYRILHHSFSIILCVKVIACQSPLAYCMSNIGQFFSSENIIKDDVYIISYVSSDDSI